ncbi:hypothetical protein HK099_008374 [Clydaea vesicula]|uniref:Skg3/CAF120-like PH-like domain-containing protein n=1 Tax=Clydaea vesicula TaxID=447962 RepID=A0AAD5U945_9FUNG|nr:hypothetical protein HK099_008374 [Clydaea vesicula]
MENPSTPTNNPIPGLSPATLTPSSQLFADLTNQKLQKIEFSWSPWIPRLFYIMIAGTIPGNNITLNITDSINVISEVIKNKKQVKTDINTTEPEEITEQSLIWPEDLHTPLALFFAQSKKSYYKGFLYIKFFFNFDGKVLTKQQSFTFSNKSAGNNYLDAGEEWGKWWVELTGSSLDMWKVPDEIASLTYKPNCSLPQIMGLELFPSSETISLLKRTQEVPISINVADASFELFSSSFKLPHHTNSSPPPPPPYNNFFGVSSCGSNLAIFAANSPIVANNWILSLSLVNFEISMLSQLYTLRLLARPENLICWSQFNLNPFETLNTTVDINYQGELKIQLPYSNVWKTYYVSLCSFLKKDEKNLKEEAKSKGIFSKHKKKDVSAKNSTDDLNSSEFSNEGSFRQTHMYLFDSKKDVKKNNPIFYIPSVTSVFSLWPNSPSAGNVASITKVECTVLTIPKEDTVKVKSQSIFKSKKASMVVEDFKSEHHQVSSLADLIVTENDNTLDNKPVPSYLLFSAGNSVIEMGKWVTAIMAAFNLDANLEYFDDLLKGNAVGFVKKEVITQELVFTDSLPAQPQVVEESSPISHDLRNLFQDSQESSDKKKFDVNHKVSESTENTVDTLTSAIEEASTVSSQPAVEEQDLPISAENEKSEVITPVLNSPLERYISSNVQWGILLLSLFEISSVPMDHQIISPENYKSTYAKSKEVFLKILADKHKALKNGFLNEWNLAAGKEDTTRLLHSQSLVESSVKKLILWHTRIKKDLEKSKIITTEVFVENEEETTLRAVPVYNLMGFWEWQYQFANLQQYESQMKLFMEFLSLNKGNGDKIENGDDDVEENFFSFEEKIEELEKLKLQDVNASHQGYGIEVNENDIAGLHVDKSFAELKEADEDQPRASTSTLIGRKSKIQLEEEPNYVEAGSLLEKATKKIEEKKQKKMENHANTTNQGPLIGIVDMPHETVDSDLKKGLLGEADKRRMILEKIKKNGYSQYMNSPVHNPHISQENSAQYGHQNQYVNQINGMYGWPNSQYNSAPYGGYHGPGMMGMPGMPGMPYGVPGVPGMMNGMYSFQVPPNMYGQGMFRQPFVPMSSAPMYPPSGMLNQPPGFAQPFWYNQPMNGFGQQLGMFGMQGYYGQQGMQDQFLFQNQLGATAPVQTEVIKPPQPTSSYSVSSSKSNQPQTVMQEKKDAKKLEKRIFHFHELQKQKVLAEMKSFHPLDPKNPLNSLNPQNHTNSGNIGAAPPLANIYERQKENLVLAQNLAVQIGTPISVDPTRSYYSNEDNEVNSLNGSNYGRDLLKQHYLELERKKSGFYSPSRVVPPEFDARSFSDGENEPVEFGEEDGDSDDEPILKKKTVVESDEDEPIFKKKTVVESAEDEPILKKKTNVESDEDDVPLKNSKTKLNQSYSNTNNNFQRQRSANLVDSSDEDIPLQSNKNDAVLQVNSNSGMVGNQQTHQGFIQNFNQQPHFHSASNSQGFVIQLQNPPVQPPHFHQHPGNQFLHQQPNYLHQQQTGAYNQDLNGNSNYTTQVPHDDRLFVEIKDEELYVENGSLLKASKEKAEQKLNNKKPLKKDGEPLIKPEEEKSFLTPGTMMVQKASKELSEQKLNNKKALKPEGPLIKPMEEKSFLKAGTVIDEVNSRLKNISNQSSDYETSNSVCNVEKVTENSGLQSND